MKIPNGLDKAAAGVRAYVRKYGIGLGGRLAMLALEGVIPFPPNVKWEPLAKHTITSVRKAGAKNLVKFTTRPAAKPAKAATKKR